MFPKKKTKRAPEAPLLPEDAWQTAREAFASALKDEAIAMAVAQSAAGEGGPRGTSREVVGDVRQGGFVIEDDTAARQAGYEVGFDPTVYRKLRAGKLVPEAVLDLHGHRADAFVALFNWLSEASRQDLRTVLVITGKGFGHGERGDMGVIKSQVCGWLARHPLVLAFATAKPADGGAGALYVHLRRWR